MPELNLEKVPYWENMWGPRRFDEEGKPKTYMTEHQAIQLVHGEKELYIVGYSTGRDGGGGREINVLSPEEFAADYSLKKNL